ncbi:MAG: molybdate ABC transporter substrate-binding protein [Chloroflexota bacterium]|nr:molybdate ABC transporter substrate-binding protein [Chloroflexota bacterium]
MKSKLLASLLLLFLPACAQEPRALTVSAAANLEPAFTELGAQFEKQTGTKVTFNFGATVQLAQQIAQGAPVDLFAAADRVTIDDLAARGIVIPETVQVYARGQIVLYTHADGPALQSLSDLTRSDIKRVAIANPERAPYGLAARQALQSAGLWTAIQPKVIIAENIQQTQQYADTGNVDAAIIALSLALISKGRWAAIPQNLYAPIDQALGVVKGAPNERDARMFAAFVTGSAGRAVLAKYGYGIPNAK